MSRHGSEPSGTGPDYEAIGARFPYTQFVSNVPPPYPGPPAPKRDKSSTILLVTVLAIVAFCVLGVAVGGYVLFRFGSMAMNTVGPMAGCAISFQSARDAVLSYARDHNGKLPNAENWQDEVKKYLRIDDSEFKGSPIEIKAITAEGDWGCYTQTEGEMTGMAFNSELAGKKISDVANPRRVIMLYEVEKPSRNARGPYSPLPRSSSPKIFGEHRGWMTMPVEGSSDFDFDSSRTRSGIGGDVKN